MNVLGVRERKRYGTLVNFTLGNYKSDVCHLSDVQVPELAAMQSRSILTRDNFNSVIKEEIKRSNSPKGCKLQMEIMRETPDYVNFILLVINSR
jgi:hypothetical protein